MQPKTVGYRKEISTDAVRIAAFFDPLKKLDKRISSHVPALRRLRWNTVTTVSDPHKR